MLLIDIGNSRLKWATEHKGKIRFGQAIDNEEITPKVLKKAWQNLQDVDAVWVSSVATSELLADVKKVAKTLWKLKPQIALVEKKACGIDNGYKTRGTLGVDRWLAAIGARSVIAKGNLIIVDAGTAVTVDWLSADNVYQGGAILPGIEAMHIALVKATFGIDADITNTKRVVGKTTQECVNAGVYYGYVGAVQRVINEMIAQNKIKAKIVMCGGGADSLSQALGMGTRLEHDLVFRGLCEVSKCAS